MAVDRYRCTSSWDARRKAELLDGVARAFWELGDKKIDIVQYQELTKSIGEATQGSGNLEQIAALAGQFEGALRRAGAELPQERERSKPPHGTDLGANDAWWKTFGLHEYARTLHTPSIRSVQDVIALTRSRFGYSDESAQKQRYAYRGEHQASLDRPLVPRRGREYRAKGSRLPDYRVVSSEESADLVAFQKEWKVGKVAAPEADLVAFADLTRGDSQWWALMQHYGPAAGKGTRLLDVTGSLFAGLMFACVSWDGRVDHDIDGVLYIMELSEVAARPMFEDADGDFADTPPDHWSKMFDMKHNIPTLYIPKKMHSRA